MKSVNRLMYRDDKASNRKAGGHVDGFVKPERLPGETSASYRQRFLRALSLAKFSGEAMPAVRAKEWPPFVKAIVYGSAKREPEMSQVLPGGKGKVKKGDKAETLRRRDAHALSWAWEIVLLCEQVARDQGLPDPNVIAEDVAEVLKREQSAKREATKKLKLTNSKPASGATRLRNVSDMKDYAVSPQFADSNIRHLYRYH